MSKDNGDGIVPWLDDKKWVPWKVTVGVVLFCGAFWLGAVYLWTIFS